MMRWLLLAALAAAEDLAFVREGCRISIHGARAILRDGARECDLWNAARNGGRRCASDRVLLCEVVFADQKAAASTHAALTVATDAAYLAAPIPGGLPRYKYVEAKAAWARAAGVAYYLAFGRGTAKANGPRCDAGAGGQTLHALKAAGLGVVMRHTEYESVTALDVDAVPALDAAHPEAWLALDAASDVFGASNVGKPVLVNGGVLVLRNTAWARELVGAWWRNRCGPADQYALWKSLAELWRRDHPKFRLSDGVFANYASARERFLPEVARRIADGALPARGCAADATCAALFRASGCLAAPLALPHLYVTPVAGPFRVADGSAVRPLQKGDHAWMCHFDRVYETLKDYDLRFAALEAAVGARDAARVPALVARVLGKDGGDRFDASCARPGDALRHALYRFNGVEPDRGRTCALALNESLQSQYAYAPADNIRYAGSGVLVKSECGTAKRYLQPGEAEEARRKCELKAARAARRAAKLRRDAETAHAYNASTPPTTILKSNCTLQRFPPIYANRVHFFSFVAADLYHLLGHALRYYRHLGLDLKNQGRIFVHNASGPVALEKTLVYLRRYEIQYKVSNEWSSQTKREAANQFLLSLPNDAWLVYPDLDEFFAFPCEVLEIMDQGGLLSGQMVDRVAYDWHLNSLRPLPRAAKMNNRSSIDYQFPRSCRLTGGLLDTNVNKYTLVPAVDAAGKRLRYINAHSVACGTRRMLRHVHAQKAMNCEGVTIFRGPAVAHFGFTKITIPVLERKLATYKALARTSGELRHRNAVEHYRKLRDSFEYCPLTKSFQFTRKARRLLMQARYCDPLPPHLERNYAPSRFCFEPTKAPRPSLRKSTPRPRALVEDDDPPDD